jgi:hypothetical protein
LLSAVVEVALGLSFLYFILSLMCSALNEVIAGVAALRARTLVKGVRHLLGSDVEADRFYAHPLVESLYRPRRKPSYIPPDVFALAVVDLYVPQVLQDEPALIVAAGTTDRLRRTLELLWREAEGDVVAFRNNVEKWFNDTMERVSGWYRRQAQIFLFVFALLISIGMNVNTVGIAQRLWTDAPLRAAVAGSAATVSPPPTGPTPVPVTDGLQRLNDDYRRLEASRLPLGWAADNRPSAWWVGAGGWGLTVLAISLGAPFWFDVLTRAAKLREAGPKPEPSSSGR